jgi:hypothetical protein
LERSPRISLNSEDALLAIGLRETGAVAHYAAGLRELTPFVDCRGLGKTTPCGLPYSASAEVRIIGNTGAPSPIKGIELLDAKMLFFLDKLPFFPGSWNVAFIKLSPISCNPEIRLREFNDQLFVGGGRRSHLRVMKADIRSQWSFGSNSSVLPEREARSDTPPLRGEALDDVIRNAVRVGIERNPLAKGSGRAQGDEAMKVLREKYSWESRIRMGGLRKRVDEVLEEPEFGSADIKRGDIDAQPVGRCPNLAYFQRDAGIAKVADDSQAAETRNDLVHEFEPLAAEIGLLE